MALLTDRQQQIAAELRAGERALIPEVPLPPAYFRRGNPDAAPTTRVGFAAWPQQDLVCVFVDDDVQPLPGTPLPADILARRAADGGLRQLMVPYAGDFQEFLVRVEAVLGLRGQPHVPWLQPRPPVQRHRSSTPLLDRLAVDLTEEARQGRLTPPIARDAQIDRVCQILHGRYKANPCLVGEPGVGKTKVIEGVAIRIQRGIPGIHGCRVLLIDAARITATAAADGVPVEQLVLEMAKEASGNRDRVILACDELHQLFSLRGAGGMNAAGILKSDLGRGRLRLIGACTHHEFRQHIQQDAAFERRFVPVPVDEPLIPDAIRIVAGTVPELEAHHRVTISAECVEAAVKLAHRLIPDRFLPDKAIDLLDQAAARLVNIHVAEQTSQGEAPVHGPVREEEPVGTADLDRRITEAIDQGDYRQAKVLSDARAAGQR